MAQRRNRRSGVEDLWRKADGTPSKRDGRGKRWRARYVDDDAREHTQAFARQVDARRWLEEQTSALVTGTHVAPRSQLLFSDAAGRYMAGLGHLSERTRYDRRTIMDSRILGRWGDRRVKDIRPSQISAWISALQGEGLSAVHIRKIVGIVRQVLDIAVADGDLARNPCASVRLPKVTKAHAEVFLEPDQLHALADAAVPYGLLVETMGILGFRWGEATALTVGDLDFRTSRIAVTKAYKEVAGRLELGPTKTGRDRRVPMPVTLEAKLQEHAAGRPPGELLWPAPGGGPLRRANFHNRVWARALADAGVPGDMWVHDLRHTAASLAIRSGANVKAVQAMLGHATASVTLDRYGHLYADDLEGLRGSLESTAYPLRTDGAAEGSEHEVIPPGKVA